MARTFQRRVEDFVCGHCGLSVSGDGYTNHCPECLWSRHVDIYPGDRAASCGALMRPVSIVMKRGEWKITHRCERCGYEKRNRAGERDRIGLEG